MRADPNPPLKETEKGEPASNEANSTKAEKAQVVHNISIGSQVFNQD